MSGKRNNLVTHISARNRKLYLRGRTLSDSHWTPQRAKATRFTFSEAYSMCMSFKAAGLDAQIMPVS